jgi:hypothetical protein
LTDSVENKNSCSGNSNANEILFEETIADEDKTPVPFCRHG